jgi:hypothetical protein
MSTVDIFEKSPVDPVGDDQGLAEPSGESLKESALKEVLLLTSVLESERDLIVSGDWERLDGVLEEKGRRSKSLSEFLSGLLPEDLAETGTEEGVPSLRSALLHLEELASVNLAIARESSMLVEHVLREISLESEGGQTYGSGGMVGPGHQSPALVSTRG